MTKTIANIAKSLLSIANKDKFVITAQAILLFVLSLAFPNHVHLGSNTILASLIGAILVSISLVASVPIAFHLFDYSKIGEYRMSLKSLTFREKLFIFVVTLFFGALIFSALTLLLPAVISFASLPVAIGVTVACEIVSLGVDQIEDLLRDTENDEGFVRQGRRKPKS